MRQPGLTHMSFVLAGCCLWWCLVCQPLVKELLELKAKYKAETGQDYGGAAPAPSKNKADAKAAPAPAKAGGAKAAAPPAPKPAPTPKPAPAPKAAPAPKIPGKAHEPTAAAAVTESGTGRQAGSSSVYSSPNIMYHVMSFTFLLCLSVCVRAADPTGPLVRDGKADLPALDAYLLRRTYMRGVVPTQDDVALLQLLQDASLEAYPSVKRWAKHMASFSADQRKAWPA